MPEGEEDVYTIGATDFSTGWWSAFSKYYVIPDGQVWNAVFNLNINPSAPNTFKNFVLILCSDGDRGANKEYGAIRFDTQRPDGTLNGAITSIETSSRVISCSGLIQMKACRSSAEQ